MARKGIQLDENNELKIIVKRGTDGRIERGMLVGDSLLQDAHMILSTNQGNVKGDPIAGTNLTRMIRGKTNMEKIRKTVSISLERIGISMDSVKKEIAYMINRTKQ